MKTLLIILTGWLLAAPLYSNAIKLTYPDWITGVAITNVAAVVLEEKMGIEVILKKAPVSEVYKSVAEGRQDVFLNAWLPFTQSEYWDKHSAELERLGTTLQRTRTGLAVPNYVEIDSITQLNSIANSVNGTITGIEADSGTTDSTNLAIREYKLQYKQVNSSTADMLAALDKATAAKEPIVITGWTPHWMFARYNIKMLRDPTNVYVSDGIRKVARPGFTIENPDAARFLKRFSLTENQMNFLLFEINQAKSSPKEIARTWVAENPELVEAWIAPEPKKGFFKKLFGN